MQLLMKTPAIFRWNWRLRTAILFRPTPSYTLVEDIPDGSESPFAVGTTWQVNKSRNQDCTYNITLATDTALSQTLEVTYDTKHGEGTYYWARNQAVGTYLSKLEEMSSADMGIQHQGGKNAAGMEDFTIRIEPLANTGGEGGDTLFRSTRFDVRAQPEYRREEVVDGNPPSRRKEDQHRYVVMIKASRITRTHTEADRVMETFWELLEKRIPDTNGNPTYEKLELIGEPRTRTVRNAFGRVLFMIEAVFRCVETSEVGVEGEEGHVAAWSSEWKPVTTALTLPPLP